MVTGQAMILGDEFTLRHS